eukprot:5616302-Prymnesium_polylepis.1
MWHGIACAGLMAVRHANERNGSVVPAFAALRKNFSAISTDSGSNSLSSVAAYRECKAAGARAIVGPAISATNVYVATLGGLDELVNLGFWTSSPTLADKAAYPYFGRSYPSDALRAPIFVQTLCLFNFSNFGIIHTDDAWANAFVKLVRAETDKPGSGVSVFSSFDFVYGSATSARSAVRLLATMATP